MLKALYYPDVPFESLFIPHIMKEIYFDRVYDEIVAGRNDLVVVDVGANIGLVTHFLRNYSKQVYCLEPATEHFEALRQNKRFNRWDNVEIFQVALADQDGTAQFNLNSGNRTMNSLVFGGDAHQNTKVVRLDTFFAENNIEHVDFLKIDVEGAEHIILNSEGFKNVLDKIDSIEIEFHAPGWEKYNEYFDAEGFDWKQYPTDATVVLYKRR